MNKLKLETFLNWLLERFGLKVVKTESTQQIDKNRAANITATERRKAKKKLFNEHHDTIQQWAGQFGYIFEPSSTYCVVQKADAHITIYYQPLTAITIIKHPKKGETVLRRQGITIKEVEDIIRNPRVHLSRKSVYMNLKRFKRKNKL